MDNCRRQALEKARGGEFHLSSHVCDAWPPLKKAVVAMSQRRAPPLGAPVAPPKSMGRMTIVEVTGAALAQHPHSSVSLDELSNYPQQCVACYDLLYL